MHVLPIAGILGLRVSTAQQHADEMELYIAPSTSEFINLALLQLCVVQWFMLYSLLLNCTNTDAIVFGTPQRLANLSRAQGTVINGYVMQFVAVVKLLGVSQRSLLICI
jgi:hypothetical protein